MSIDFGYLLSLDLIGHADLFPELIPHFLALLKTKGRKLRICQRQSRLINKASIILWVLIARLSLDLTEKVILNAVKVSTKKVFVYICYISYHQLRQYVIDIISDDQYLIDMPCLPECIVCFQQQY